MAASADWPAALVGVPVSPEEALDAASRWAEAGYQGGIVRSIDFSHEDSLGSVLADDGLPYIFLEVDWPVDLPILTDSDGQYVVLGQAEAAGARAANAELHGLALFIPSSALPFEYHWDGYPWEYSPPEELADRAVAFGKAFLRALRREGPEAEILLIADRLTAAAPLWFRFFEGMVEASRLTGTAPPTLVIRDGAFEDHPVTIETRARRMDRLLRHHLSTSSAAYWDDASGALALALDTAGEGAWPIRLLAARLASARYILVENQGTGFPAIATPLDAHQYVGALSLETGDDAHVFAGEGGAALLLWRGLSGPLTLSGSTRAPQVRDLVTGQERTFPFDSAQPTLGPLVGPALIEGLSMRSWAVPACLWLDLEPQAPALETPAAFGFVNRLGFHMDGAITATGEAGFGIRPNTAVVELAPGEAFRADGLMRGELYAGRRFTLGLTAFGAGGDAVPRLFTYTAYPRASWEARMRGPIHGAPLVLHHEGVPHTLVTSREGEIASYGVSGGVRWRRWLPTRFEHGPVAVAHWTGEPIAVTADHRGWLRAFDLDGELRWESRPVAQRPSTPPLSVNAHGFPGRETLLAYENGTIACVLSNGQLLWEHRLSGRRARVAAGDITRNGRDDSVIVLEDTADTIHVRQSDGRPLWRAEAGFTPSTEPLLIDLSGDGTLELVFAGDRGEIEIRDALWGRLREEARLVTQAPVMGLAVAHGPGEDARILAATALGLTCLDADLAVQWTVPVACSAAPAVVEHDGPPYLLVPALDGSLTFLTLEGERLWTIPGTGVPLTTTPTIGLSPPHERFEAATVCADYAVRMIPLE